MLLLILLKMKNGLLAVIAEVWSGVEDAVTMQDTDI